ncbi:dynein axonemal intermediate chain 7 [Cylas formicarius]|uniref:dynein axonemal intermediate chain 7 n=1 Tax=Cylas formicarius TaxID=197179 RepID=UPI002958B6F4|nr:dynein axonemal intermediate chain 7 [Cylas formicarius]
MSFQASKKKLSKKEKARMTAELAEKARLEAEAQAKMLEELMKQKHEQDRLAAIEKDKKEAVEHQLRIEQLQESRKLMDDIVESYLELERLEREEIEWKKYVDCGRLPNPLQCDRMNTYLHLWEQVISDTTVEDASARTADVIQLLEELDEHLDAEEDPSLVKNLKWIRSMFRDRQKESLDVATYKLLRNVEHNLNRINIPTADFNFKDEYVTLCLWLRVMLPIPLPNPRRPPKPRIDVDFTLLEASVLFPSSIDCENAAIRAMYLKYDHLSDTSDTYKIPQLRKRYCWDLLEASKLEWRAKRKYKYDNRDKEVTEVDETQGKADTLTDGDVVTDEIDEFKSDDEIPSVPFKQLDPTASAFAITCEDNLYAEIRTALLLVVPEHVINLRRFVILGGVYHLDYLAQPPQPQDFITMDMTITALSLPKKLETVPFYAAYNPPLPPEDPTVRRLPEEIEEEMRRQEAELDKLIAVNIKWPQHVIFLELPVVCRWDEEARRWSKKEIFDLKHNEDKCVLSFRTGVFGTFGLATYRYANLPFQAYDIKPEADDSVTVQLTAAILMLEFNIKEGLVCITQLQNSPNMALQDIVGTYFKLPRLKRILKEAGIDIFPSLDAFCYVEGSCEKQWAMERHLYFNMAQLSNCFNFAWSRWNLQAGRRSIVLQMRNYVPSKAKQKTHQMLLITPQRASFVDCTEVSQVFSDNDVEPIKFCADLYHLMKTTSGIFVRNKVLKTSKVNVYALANFLESIRILSFS